MREILKLMFPVYFTGNIYHKAAMAICLPFLVACYALSVWSNTHGIESVFASLPDYAIKAATFAAYVLDPVNWLCFTLLIVSVIAFRVIENLEKQEQLPKQLSKGVKPTLVFACMLFASLVCVLTYATYLLSQKGGNTGATAYISNEYAPKQQIDQIISSNKQVLKQELSSIDSAYAAQVSNLDSLISVSINIQAANKHWLRLKKSGRSWFGTYKRQNQAKAEEKLLRQELKELRQLIESKKVETKNRSSELLAAQKATYAETKQKHDELQQETASIMSYAVQSWTVFGLLIQLISFVLTSDRYKTAAYAFVKQTLLNFNNQQSSISKELLLISANNQAPKQIQKPLEFEQKPLKQELEEVTEIKQLPKQEEAVEQAINEAPKQAPVQDQTQEIINQIKARVSTQWLMQWKPALSDPDLNGISKKKLVDKYSTSLSTVDNLRRTKATILTFIKVDERKPKQEQEKEREQTYFNVMSKI